MDLVPKPSLVEKQFWLLDISGEEVDGVEQIWVWGIDEEGHPCILVEKGQKTRFYIAFDDKDDAVEAKKKFGEILKKQGEHAELTLKEMKRLGKLVYTVEVNCQPMALQNLSKRASEIFGGRKIFEDDIRVSQRFLIHQDIVPSSWHLATAEKICDKKGIDFYAMQGLKRLDLERSPKLRVMGFDAIYYSKVGEADPERDPVAIISLRSREGEAWQYSLEEGEKKILEEFIEVIRQYDPDVLVGFEANSTHWSYLLKRAERYGVSLAVGRLEREPHQSLYGHFSVAGRINFDLNDYAAEYTAIQRKTLEELATYLGISMDGVEAVDPFLHSRKWVEDRESLLKYSEWRAEVMVKAFELISDHVFSLSSTTGIPTDYVQTASPGFRLDNYIMREASKRGELIPKPRDGYSPSYTGGRVLSPIPGLHSNIAVVDFKALYPSLMVKHNISPDTVVTPPFPSGEDILIVPEVEVGILQGRKGFFTEILKRIMEKREETRQRMKRFSKGTADYKLLDSRQRALKVLANAMYGYMGWAGARWYVREGAMAVAALGREVIKETVKKANEMGLTVIYGDTDSLFIEYTSKKVDDLLGWIEKDLRLEAKLEKVYEKVVFTEAKKRYAGLTKENELDVVGLEMVRRDWCDYARETQGELLRIVLSDGGLDEILSYVKDRSSKLKRREIDPSKLIIWERITRLLKDYVAKGAHITVAAQLAEKGWKIKKGDYVGYVITTGDGPLYKRAKHYTEASPEQIDTGYYVEKQVLPVCSRVTSVLGIKMKELKILVSGEDLLSYEQ